jgi:hypothetical protein
VDYHLATAKSNFKSILSVFVVQRQLSPKYIFACLYDLLSFLLQKDEDDIELPDSSALFVGKSS